VGGVFLRREGSSQHHRCAEEAEVTLRNVDAMDLLRLVAGDVEAGAGEVVSGNFLEYAGLLLIDVKLGNAGKVVGKEGRREQKLDDAIGVG